VGSWVRYGGEVVCLPHAQEMVSEAVPVVAKLVVRALLFGGQTVAELTRELDLDTQIISQAIDYLWDAREIIELDCEGDPRWALAHAEDDAADVLARLDDLAAGGANDTRQR
jgi:hypothetical protein